MRSPRASRQRIAAITAAASIALLGAGGLSLGHSAHAALVDAPVTGEGGRLVLAADPHPVRFGELSPGDPFHWLVTARLERASSATLTLELRKDGQLVHHPRGLRMSVTACDTAWTMTGETPRCETGAREIALGTPTEKWSTGSPTFPLGPLRPTEKESLLVTLALEDSPAARSDATLMGLEGAVGLGITAVALDDAPVLPFRGGHLPSTGTDAGVLAGVVAAAVGALGLGLSLRVRRGRVTG